MNRGKSSNFTLVHKGTNTKSYYPYHLSSYKKVDQCAKGSIPACRGRGAKATVKLIITKHLSLQRKQWCKGKSYTDWNQKALLWRRQCSKLRLQTHLLQTKTSYYGGGSRAKARTILIATKIPTYRGGSGTKITVTLIATKKLYYKGGSMTMTSVTLMPAINIFYWGVSGGKG